MVSQKEGKRLGAPLLQSGVTSGGDAKEAPIAVPAEASIWWRKSRLIFYTVCLLVSSVGNQVYFKRMTSAMPNYGWYLTQLSTIIYVPFFLILAGTNAASVHLNLVQKFGLMGVFDGLAGTLMVLGGVHTSGTMQVLLSQGVIPITMGLSFVVIGKRYHLLQLVGAATIFIGIVLAKAAAGESDSLSANDPVFNMLFIFSLLPAALSSVFKEVAFRGFDGDLDVNVLQFWVASFQVLVNFVAMPIYTLDVLGPQQVAIDEMPTISIGGSRCLFLLQDQVVENCGLPGERPCDHCENAWASVVGYLSFNLSYNICTMMVIKHGSAALSFLVATLRMPLSSVAFSSTWIMGQEAVSPTMGDYVSLGVIICGLGCYRFGARLLKKRRHREQEALAAAGMSPGPEWASPTASPRPSAAEYPSGDQRKGVAVQARWQPLFSTAGLPSAAGPSFTYVPGRRTVRSVDRMREDLYRRLGAASPLCSPRLRSHSPPGSPNVVPEALPTPPQSLYLPPSDEVEEEERFAYRPRGRRSSPRNRMASRAECASTGAGSMDFDLSGLPEEGDQRPNWLARKSSKQTPSAAPLFPKECTGSQQGSS